MEDERWITETKTFNSLFLYIQNTRTVDEGARWIDILCSTSAWILTEEEPDVRKIDAMRKSAAPGSSMPSDSKRTIGIAKTKTKKEKGGRRRRRRRGRNELTWMRQSKSHNREATLTNWLKVKQQRNTFHRGYFVDTSRKQIRKKNFPQLAFG